MKEWDFDEIYKALDLMRKDFRGTRKVWNKKGRFKGDKKSRKYILFLKAKNEASDLDEVIEKCIALVEDHFYFIIQPAYEFVQECVKNNEKCKDDCSTWRCIVEEREYMVMLIHMSYELLNKFCIETFGGHYWNDPSDYGPDVDFAAMPELPSVLKATDSKSMIARMSWLVDNFYKDGNARLYLKTRLKAAKDAKDAEEQTAEYACVSAVSAK